MAKVASFVLALNAFAVGSIASSDDFERVTATKVAFETTVNRSKQYETYTYLVVDKTALKAELRTWPENPADSVSLRTFKIAIGKEEGDKQVQGDNKTPEGVYWATEIKHDDELPAKYGPNAIPINFPNPMDQRQGKTGYGIWLHGVENNTRVDSAKVTEGCVAFYNEEIKLLTDWLVPQQSVVIIAKAGSGVNQLPDVLSLQEASRNWAGSWQNRHLDNYVSHYHDQFMFRGMGKSQFKDYKSRVFKSYNSMDLGFSEMRVFTHPKYGVTVMNQDFNGDNRYVSQGRKFLYWKKDDAGQWKIVHERFEHRRQKALSFSESERQTLLAKRSGDPQKVH